MSRRTWTLVVAGLLIVALAMLASLLPVPYVRLTPGPTTDTLGTVKDKSIIVIEGRQTFPSKGRLDLTTVAVSSSEEQLDLVQAIQGWLSSDIAVVPRETVYPDEQSTEQIEQENAEQMSLSQQHAAYAALRELNVPVQTTVLIESVQKDSPALGLLHAGDEILAVDGKPVLQPTQVREAVRSHTPGQPVTFQLRRAGQIETAEVITRAAEDDAKAGFVGFKPARGYRFPFKVSFSLADVGGPSAGLMFALGVVDKLTREDLTGGQVIAGTGTIDDGGVLGEISGIEMKMRGAAAGGATVFLLPRGNCDAALGDVPKGLRLVPAKTLKEALGALELVRAGSDDLPRC